MPSGSVGNTTTSVCTDNKIEGIHRNIKFHSLKNCTTDAYKDNMGKIGFRNNKSFENVHEKYK